MTTPDLAGLCERLRRYHNDCTPPRMDYALSDGLAFALTEAAAAIERLVAENERMREALVQADLTIRSLPATDQSHVEFIRTALEGASDDR